MAQLSFLDAYTQIKNLEANGTLIVPAPTDTIVVGSIDAQTGAFTFKVPTFTQTTVDPPPPQQPDKPPPIRPKAADPNLVEVGVVATNCVNLILAFDVTNVSPLPVVKAEPLDTGDVRFPAGPITGPGLIGSTGDVTISGFPIAGTQGSTILLNAGLAVSTEITLPTVKPPVSTFQVEVTVHGQKILRHIAILRPPVLAGGGFTIPALPAAIVFAPPQGQLAKNSNTFTDKVTTTTTTTISVGTQTAKKTAPAYTVAQILTNIGGLIADAAGMSAIVDTLTTSAGPASAIQVIGGLLGLGGGGRGSQTSTVSNVLKDASAGWNTFTGILNGVTGQGTNSDTSSITTQTNNTLSISLTSSDTYGSAAGLGPGAGDRFVWLENVRALWFNLGGNIGLTVLGYDGVAAFPGEALAADKQALTAGGKATNTGLDANTIELLLALDPYYVVSNSATVSAPLIAPPRFVPLVPMNRSGDATGSSGDIFSLANEQVGDTSTTNTNQTIGVTDVKSGWIDVMFGADNTETTTTVTGTNTVTSDQKTDETITNTITLVSASQNDSYNVNLYFDNLFQTILAVDVNSPVLGGTSTIPISESQIEPAEPVAESVGTT